MREWCFIIPNEHVHSLLNEIMVPFHPIWTGSQYARWDNGTLSSKSLFDERMVLHHQVEQVHSTPDEMSLALSLVARQTCFPAKGWRLFWLLDWCRYRQRRLTHTFLIPWKKTKNNNNNSLLIWVHCTQILIIIGGGLHLHGFVTNLGRNLSQVFFYKIQPTSSKFVTWI